jgi:hypothetical protein
MTKQSRAKSAIFYALFLCGTIGLIELIPFVAYRIAFGEWFSYRQVQSSRLSLLQPSPEAALQPSPEDAAVAGQQPAWVIHPYYGYVTNPHISRAVDKFGFLGNEDQIQSASPDKVVVAVVGASVAAQLASPTVYAAGILKSELKKIPAFQSKELVILNLANGAYKQPQALMTINDIISRDGHIDVLIALDGVGDIALAEAHGNLNHGISPFYPQNWELLVDSTSSIEQTTAFANFRLTQTVRVWLASIFAKPVLRHLIITNFIWRVADARLAGIMAEYRASANKVVPKDITSRLSHDRRAFMGPPIAYATRRDLYVDIARNWGKSSLMLHNLMRTQGGLYFHFIQPNQYVVGSKPLGEHERTVAIHPISPYRKGVEIGYPYLQAMGESLRSAGVWFEDLTPVFAGIDQELYNDNCCHVNNEGNLILARKIAAVIAARMSNLPGGISGPLRFDQVNFNNSIFGVRELRRFVSNPSDYSDGSQDKIGPASEK